jgi:hypothetical protein
MNKQTNGNSSFQQIHNNGFQQMYRQEQRCSTDLQQQQFSKNKQQQQFSTMQQQQVGTH